MVESTPAMAPPQMLEILPEHLAYQKQMESEGKLFLAGPLSDASGAEMSGGGLIIYRAASLEEARALTENDPMHKKGGRTFTLRKWLVNEGSLSISVGFASQTASLS
ncbi:MAG: YciI family protein [Hyphomicrobiales bacterium]